MADYESPTEYSHSRAAWLAPALYLALGLGVGVGLMFVFAKSPPPRTVLVPVKEQTTVSNEATTPQLETEPSEATPNNVVQEDDDPAKPATGSSAEPPHPPLEGKLGSGAPPIGNLPPGALGTAPVNPIVIESDKPAEVEAFYTEFLAIVPELEVEPTIQQMKRLVSGAGGTVTQTFTLDPERPEIGSELFVAIPKDKAQSFRQSLGKTDAVELDRWNGPVTERRSRMTRTLRDTAQKLEERLNQLRLKYFDDAPSVVETKASLERYQKAIAGVKSVSADRETFRIYIGKPAR